MPNDLKCNLLRSEFAGCPPEARKRTIIWISALGKDGEPQSLAEVALVAQERVAKALQVAPFLQNHWEKTPQFKNLEDVSDKLGKIAGYYKSIKGAKDKIEKNTETLKLIYEAIKVLDDDQIMINDPAAAAAAFDKLFLGFGFFAKKFPPPFDSTVGEFLSELGSSGFFGNVSVGLDPNRRSGGNENRAGMDGMESLGWGR